MEKIPGLSNGQACHSIDGDLPQRLPDTLVNWSIGLTQQRCLLKTMFIYSLLLFNQFIYFSNLFYCEQLFNFIYLFVLHEFSLVVFRFNTTHHSVNSSELFLEVRNTCAKFKAHSAMWSEARETIRFDWTQLNTVQCLP